MENKTFICQTKNSNYITIENDIAEIIDILQKELSERQIKAVIVSLIRGYLKPSYFLSSNVIIASFSLSLTRFSKFNIFISFS
mgnify:CR=1 FL=1